jgi:hypothetical protein
MVLHSLMTRFRKSPLHFPLILAFLAWQMPATGRAQANKVAGAAAETALSPIAKEAAEKAAAELLEEATVEAGKEVAEESSKTLQAQLAKAAGKYGESVTAMARRVPEASTALATRAPQLVPLAEKFGDDILRLEARAPGFGELAAVSFGKQDLPRLLKLGNREMKSVVALATHSTEPRAARLLLEGTEKGGKSFIEKISARQVLAGGLSVAAVLAAYRAAGIFESSPEIAVNGATKVIAPISYTAALLLAAWGGLASWRRHRRASAMG